MDHIAEPSLHLWHLGCYYMYVLTSSSGTTAANIAPRAHAASREPLLPFAVADGDVWTPLPPLLPAEAWVGLAACALLPPRPCPTTFDPPAEAEAEEAAEEEANAAPVFRGTDPVCEAALDALLLRLMATDPVAAAVSVMGVRIALAPK